MDLLSTNHMLETDKLQNEVRYFLKYYCTIHLTVFVCVDFQPEETAGAQGSSNVGQRQADVPTESRVFREGERIQN